MTAHPSLTTSRLAALSLSPSRIAQLGVKQGSRGSSDNGETDALTRGNKGEPSGNTSADGKSNHEGDSEERKGSSLNVPKPEIKRRSSSLNSLSDDGDDDGDGADGFATGDESESSGDGRNVGLGSGKEAVVVSQEPMRNARTTDNSASIPVPTTVSSHPAASTSRERSPPPSYDYAILPSSLHQSTLTSPSNNHTQNEDAESMSARRRGKQRDMRDSGREDGAGGRSVEGREKAMLEMLPNSDTSEGEDGFPQQTLRPSPPHSRRDEEDEPPPRQNRAPHSVLLAPQLGKSSSVRRKRPPILATSTRSRSSYTGPVEMIDRSGEGWAESLADEEAEAVPEGGYDLSPQLDTPTRPALLSGSSSSFIRALPSPSSGAFTQDARILGWKIIGGRYKTTRDRNGNGRETGNGMWSGREDHDSGIDDPQKPGIGAYVGALPFCNLVGATLMSSSQCMNAK